MTERCDHGFVKGLCTAKSCPHWDGVDEHSSNIEKHRTRRACIVCGTVIHRSSDYCKQHNPDGDGK